MSDYGDQIHCENLDCVGQLEICQVGYLLTHPHIVYDIVCKQSIHERVNGWTGKQSNKPKAIFPFKSFKLGK